MIDTVGIGVIENSYLACSSGTVAGAAGLLPSIVGFDVVGPHQIEDSRLGFDVFRIAKHILLHVLVELKEFGFLPVAPVVLVLELTTGKAVCSCILVNYTSAIHSYPADTSRNRTLEKSVGCIAVRNVIIILKVVTGVELIQIDKRDAGISETMADLTMCEEETTVFAWGRGKGFGNRLSRINRTFTTRGLRRTRRWTLRRAARGRGRVPRRRRKLLP